MKFKDCVLLARRGPFYKLRVMVKKICKIVISCGIAEVKF